MSLEPKDFLTSSEPERDSFDFLAREFLTAPEFLALYGDDPSDMDYVDAMYQNVLGRLPDQGGYDFWVGAMEDGQDRADILIYCQRRSKIGPRGGAKLGHFGFAGDARGV